MIVRTLFLLLVLGLAAGAAVVWDGWRALNEPLPIRGEQVVVFERGQSLGRLVQDLTRQGAFPRGRTRHYLNAWTRYTGVANRLKAGEYVLAAGLTPLTLLDKLERGEVRQYRLTLVEGWSFRELLAMVWRHPAIRRTIHDEDPGAAVMRALGQADQHPEGRFLPDTYLITRGTTDLDLLRRAYDAMVTAQAEVWAGRAEGIPIQTPDEMLILASIIEKETGQAGERAQIAGVFSRRLQRGMKLQTDPTVIYGIGPEFDGNIRRRDLRRDTPYNTYTRHGLPPTPICMPGRAALEAAVNPAPGESLYFVSRGDGSHVFSDTLAEHNRAVRRWQLGGR